MIPAAPDYRHARITPRFIGPDRIPASDASTTDTVRTIRHGQSHECIKTGPEPMVPSPDFTISSPDHRAHHSFPTVGSPVSPLPFGRSESSSRHLGRRKAIIGVSADHSVVFSIVSSSVSARSVAPNPDIGNFSRPPPDSLRSSCGVYPLRRVPRVARTAERCVKGTSCGFSSHTAL